MTKENGKMTFTFDSINPQDKYTALLIQTKPHVIKTEKDYDKALALVEELMSKDSLTSEEDALLDLWVTLIERYEAEECQISLKNTPLERLLFLMDANNLKQIDLVSIFGSKGTTSEVINGKRKISVNAAVKLGKFFNLSSATFLP